MQYDPRYNDKPCPHCGKLPFEHRSFDTAKLEPKVVDLQQAKLEWMKELAILREAFYKDFPLQKTR